MKTKEDIDYRVAPYGFIATIPAGTECEPASNLPGEQYWAKPWDNMTEKARDWVESYGFLLNYEDVI